MNKSDLIEYAHNISPRLSQFEGWKAYATRAVQESRYGVSTKDDVGILALGFEAGTRENEWLAGS